MTIQLTVGATANTLVDDAANPRVAGVIEALAGRAIVQAEPLYGAANNFTAARGNVSGQFVFTAACSFANYGDAAAAMKAAYNLLNATGSLVLSYGGTTFTMANAILRDVTRVEWNGVHLKLRYTFDITTIT